MTVRDLAEQVNVQGNIVLREIKNGETAIDVAEIVGTDWFTITKEIEPYVDRVVTFIYADWDISGESTLIIELAEED